MKRDKLILRSKDATFTMYLSSFGMNGYEVKLYVVAKEQDNITKELKYAGCMKDR